MAKRSVDIVIKGKDRATGPLKKAGKATDGFITKIGALKLAALAAAAAIAAKVVSSITEATQSIIDMGDKMQKTALATGLSTEFLSGLSHATEIAGSSFAAMPKALKTMSLAAQEANRGLKTYTETFDDLGISVNNASGELKPMKQIFLETADAIAAEENETRRLALASKVFGRGAIELMPLLREGRKGISGLIDESAELGLQWSQKNADAAAEFKDAMARMKGAFLGIIQSIVVDMLPTMQRWATAIKEWAIEHKEQIKAVVAVISGFVNFFIGAAKLIWNIVYNTIIVAIEFLKETAIKVAALIVHSVLMVVKGWVWMAEQAKYLFGEVIIPVMTWFVRIWGQLLETAWNLTKSFAKGVGNFFSELVTSIKRAVTGGGFSFEWTGLLEGFESTLEKFPEIAERQLSDTEKRLNAKIASTRAIIGRGLFDGDQETPDGPAARVVIPEAIAASAATSRAAAIGGPGAGGSGPAAEIKQAVAEQSRVASATSEKAETRSSQMVDLLVMIEQNTRPMALETAP